MSAERIESVYLDSELLRYTGFATDAPYFAHFS